MTTSLAFQGNLQFQPTGLSVPAPLPFGFTQQYTSAADLVLSNSGVLTHQSVYLGTLTAPKFMLVIVEAGSLSVEFDVSGTGAVQVTSNPSPPPNDPPFMCLFTYAFSPFSLHISCTAGTTARIWLFQ
jgi:hypothetical protein